MLVQLLYGCEYVREIIHSLKRVDYPPVHTHKPYNNLHLYHSQMQRPVISRVKSGNFGQRVKFGHTFAKSENPDETAPYEPSH